MVVNMNVYLQPTPEDKHSVRFSRTHPELQNRAPQLGAYLASITGPDERIYDYGREAQLYFYADRLPASRFFSNRSFFLDPPTTEETVNALREAPPAVIVDTMTPRLDFDPKDAPPPAFRDLLEEDYLYAGRVEFADVYLLKP